jgi:hypothetical protein
MYLRIVVSDRFSSVIRALIIFGAVLATLNIGSTRGDSDWPKYLLAWLVIGYIAVQLLTLLETLLSVRFTGILDTAMTIVPFVLGLVALVNTIQGTLHLSTYQVHALYLLLAT